MRIEAPSERWFEDGQVANCSNRIVSVSDGNSRASRERHGRDLRRRREGGVGTVQYRTTAGPGVGRVCARRGQGLDVSGAAAWLPLLLVPVGPGIDLPQRVGGSEIGRGQERRSWLWHEIQADRSCPES